MKKQKQKKNMDYVGFLNDKMCKQIVKINIEKIATMSLTYYSIGFKNLEFIVNQTINY